MKIGEPEAGAGEEKQEQRECVRSLVSDVLKEVRQDHPSGGVVPDADFPHHIQVVLVQVDEDQILPPQHALLVEPSVG
jgi:hypothetical protein